MPTVPIADLEQLDLTREIVSKEELYKPLKQRGRLAVLDGVLFQDLEGDLVVGYKDIRADDWWAEDHIPGRPIFPGTLMLEASAQLCSFDFYKRRPEAAQKFVGFTAIHDTRYRAMVEPPCRFLIVAKVTRVRSGLFTYKFQGVVDGAIVFQSAITGMVL